MNTALRAEETKAIIFISEAHEKFYYEKLKEVRCEDVYHKALVYCLGICNDTRNNIYRIFDFQNGLVKPKCLNEGWQTSGNHSHLQNEISSNISIEVSKSTQTEQRDVSTSNEYENQTSSTEMKQSLEKNEVSPIARQEEGEVSDKIAEMLLVMKICQELGRSAVVDWNETAQAVIIKDGEGTVEGKEAYEILFSEAADYIIDQTYDGYVKKGLDMADWMKELGKYTSRYYKQETVSEQIGIRKAPTNKISIKEKLSEKKAEITKRENSILKEKTTKSVENVL